MSIAVLISALPPWALFILVTLFCMAMAEAGALIANRRVKKGVFEPSAAVGTAVASMLGLLAFMLGFTFSLTASRFSERKGLVIQQANAIGTCYLRTSFLPENQKDETRAILQQYVDLLLKLDTLDSLEEDLANMDALQLELWGQTASLQNEDMDAEIRALFITSVNEVIDITGARKTVALVFRIPGMIWIALFLLAGIGMFSIGYQTGSFGLKSILDLSLLAASFALVIVMIADMDSAGLHRFKVSQQPFIDLQKTIQADIP